MDEKQRATLIKATEHIKGEIDEQIQYHDVIQTKEDIQVYLDELIGWLGIKSDVLKEKKT